MSAVAMMVAVLLSQKVTALASIAPDGSKLALTGGAQRFVRLVMPDGGVQQIPQELPVSSLAFTEDGASLVLILSDPPGAPGDLWLLDLSTQQNRRVDLGAAKVRRCVMGEKAPVWIGCEVLRNGRLEAERIPLRGGSSNAWKSPFRTRAGDNPSLNSWLFDGNALPRVAVRLGARDAGAEVVAVDGPRTNSLWRLGPEERFSALGVSADGTTLYAVTTFMGAGPRLVQKATRSGTTRTLVDSGDAGLVANFFDGFGGVANPGSGNVSVAWNSARRTPDLCRDAADGGEFATCAERNDAARAQRNAVIVDRNRADTQWLSTQTVACDSASCPSNFFWWDRSRKQMLFNGTAW